MAQDGPAERLDFPNLAAEGDAMAELLEAEQASLSSSLPGESPMDVEPEPTTPASSPETPVPEIPMDSPDDGNGADVPIAVRGAGWNSPMASLPSEPAMPAGLGEGGMSPTSKRMGDPSRVEEQRPAKQVREEPPKKPKIGKLHTEEVWKAVAKWAESTEEGNPHAIQRLAAVMGWLDGVLDTQEVQKARLAQLEKLWKKNAFVPVHKTDVPKGSKIFHFKWVDKQRDGVYKSRFTCADVKRKYSSEEEQDMNVFVPTPTPESHALLEVSAMRHGYAMRTFDIVSDCFSDWPRPRCTRRRTCLHESPA